MLLDQDWQEPVRTFVVWLLAGENRFCGDAVSNQHLARIEKEKLARVHREGTGWQVYPTGLGYDVALQLATSSELLQLLFLYAKVHKENLPWTGVKPSQIVAELDVRDGGDGNVRDIKEWLVTRGVDSIRALPGRATPKSRSNDADDKQ